MKFEKRKVAMDYLTELLARITDEKHKKMMKEPVIGVGEKVFSPNELLEEVRKDSDEGNRFLDAIYASKLELLKKKSAQEDEHAIQRSN